MTSIDSANLKKMIFDIAGKLSYECVGVEFHNCRSGTSLRVFIDSPEGIRHADCERVSRAISENLDLTENEGASFFKGKYFIEVSSPGLERPLYAEEHYARFTGRRASVTVKGRGKIAGVILSCENGVVVMQTGESEKISLRVNDISKGNLLF
jgi:ribosome maturation factor RimP